METVEIINLTADRLDEALDLFKTCRWSEESLFYVQAEMQSFIKGDINGYIRNHFITAISADRIIGIAAWAPSMCSFWLYELSWATVLPEWRHRGINTRLLAARLRQIRKHHGLEAFNVMVCTWNNPMYARYGFVPQQPQGRTSPDKQGKCLLLAHFDTAKAEESFIF